MPTRQSLARSASPSAMRPLTPALIVAAGIAAMVLTTVGYLLT